MLITQTTYHNTATRQGATIRIIQRELDYAITTTIGEEDAWCQTATTEPDARIISHYFHAQLTLRYGMVQRS